MERRSKRKAAPVVDLCSDSEGDEIRVFAPPKRQKLSKTIDFTSNDENEPISVRTRPRQSSREVFRELSAAEYQKKIEGPKAWVAPSGVKWLARSRELAQKQRQRQRPNTSPRKEAVPVPTDRRSGSIRDYFSSRPNGPSTSRSRVSRHHDSPTATVAHAGPVQKTRRKSLRAASVHDYSTITRITSDDSEDDLAEPARVTKATRSARKPNLKQSKADDSDFELLSEGSSESQDDGEGFSAEESDSGNEEQFTDSPPRTAPKVIKSQPQSNEKHKPTRYNMAKLHAPPKGAGRGLDLSLPPMIEPRDIFDDIVSKAMNRGFGDALAHLSGHIKVATMCSGTESPLLALELIRDCIGPSSELTVEHLFSAEIVPYKQSYINRNFSPPVVFRDITELTSVVDDADPVATTAYGGKARVPRDVDMLIAGTSCVDYSKLNNKQKTIDDGGESGDTYRAVLAYCKVFRPSIVLLENVLGADWDRMLDDYKEIGYETAGACVDSKLYYIPQTRQRGYMVCFDTGRTNVTSAGAGKKWVDLMEYFRRPASSPASALMLPNDKIIARRQMKDGEASTESDWTKCELRHNQHRYELRLGNERPVTHWSESGTLIVPEIGQTSWYTGQVERVWDLMDIVVLRKALPQNGFYDARFKTRIWDVSQNVDRDKDGIAFGISGCITPSGQFFLSDAGRVLSSEELLKMQGLPLNKISFTTETSRQIQDLAGNAMSTPLIGCAIVAALIAGHKAINPDLDRAAPLVTDVDTFVSAEMIPVPETHAVEADLLTILDRAQRAGRLCVCEGSRGMTASPLQQCTQCGHTSCTSCGGNPVHVYRQNTMLGIGRLSPTDFEDYLRNVLPLKLTFSSKTAWRNLDLPDAFKASVEGVNGVYSLQTIRRTHTWTITYRSLGGRADLVLAQDQAEWRVYAEPPTNSPANSDLRSQLRQPVAIGIAQKSLVAETWRIRYPNDGKAPIQVKEGSGIASWWARCGLVDFGEHTVPSYLDLKVNSKEMTELNGRYEYLPHCGTASDSLFKKADLDNPDDPMFLFLDPTGIGEPDKDCFVFARSMERMEQDEVRPIVARVAAPWRPWSRPDTQPTKPMLALDDVWQSADNDCALVLLKPEIQLTRLDDVDLLLNSAACSQTVHLLRARVSDDARSGPREGDIHVGDIGFFSTYNWVLNAMGRCLPEDWHSLAIAGAHSCVRCAPPRPKLRWALQESTEVRPYEDPESATLYEQAMKTRPEAVVIKASWHANQLMLDLGINMATLAHRASARLPRSLTSGCQYDWRIRQTTNRTPFVFKKFRLRSNEDDDAYDSEEPLLSVNLFKQQKQSLGWMIAQEEGVDFNIEETEEALLAPLGWMAEVRARAFHRIRGGICADHPGFGKTITSLALIHSQSSRSVASVLAELQQRQPAGLYSTAATLIICPSSLQQQWLQEIQDKIGTLDGVISIPTAAALSKFSVERFQKAKIIVVNRSVLDVASYTDRLASFAAVPGPAATSGRVFAQWRENAMEQIPKHLAILKRGQAELKKHVQTTYAANLTNDSFKAYVPSRRLRGQNYVANKGKQLTASKAAAPTAIDTSTVGEPLFEMFYFNRLIVDEFHNAGPTEAAAIFSLKADKRWGLSGTPAVDDFYQVSQVARLLGAELPLGSLDRAVMRPGSIKALQADLTNSEQFDIGSRQLPSQERYAAIYAQHQRFLTAFVRQNVGDFSALPYAEHLVPVILEVEQRLLYTELSQHLNTLQMRIKKGGRSKVTDRSKRFNDAVASSTSAEAALSKAAAFCDQVSHFGESDGVLLDDLVASCTGNVETLKAQIVTVAGEALASEPEKFSMWKTTRLTENGLRDEATAQEITMLLEQTVTKQRPTTKRRKLEGEKGDATTSKLQSLCTRLLIERRSLRYLQNAKMLQKSAQNGGLGGPCDSPGCAGIVDEVAISSVCGHLVCQACYTRLKSRAASRCIDPLCESSLLDHHLLWSSRMGDLRKKDPSPYGAKLESVMRLLQNIQDQSEQAILFVQYENQLDEVQRALKKYGIRSIVVQNAAAAGSQIKDFQDSATDATKTTVIVLNASSETAAGSNLQNANHVVFLSPLLRETQYSYDSTMAQAIGRVRRFGQTRPIHVYRVVAIDTIDVDILEHREQRNAALEEQHASRINAPAGPLHEDAKVERTQLVRENDRFSLRPKSWLVSSADTEQPEERAKAHGKNRVLGWEDFSSLVKFSSTFTEDDDE